MKEPLRNAQRWLEQAEHNLEVAQTLAQHQFWSDTCFMAEQAAQMALEAFLYGKRHRFIPIHSIQELAIECAKIEPAFNVVIDWGKVLDKYYLPSRYPDALAPPAVPYKSFTQEEADNALKLASKISEIVKAHLTLLVDRGVKDGYRL